MSDIKYHNYNYCIKCNGINKIKTVDDTDGGICECETTCTGCGHEDYWAYGFYQSTTEPPKENVT